MLGRHLKIGVVILFCAVLVEPTLMKAESGTNHPNIFFVILDDVPDYLIERGKSPNLDQLRSQGMTFTQFEAAPTCSPSRGQFQTGRQASGQSMPGTDDDGTGLGRATTKLGEVDSGYDLKRSECTLAEMIKIGTNDAYQCGVFGKWHLAVRGDLMHPLDHGYDKAAVTQFNIDLDRLPDPETYNDFEAVIDGTPEAVNGTYCTTYFVDKTLEWVQSLPTNQPLLVVLNPLVTHHPFHFPPDELIPLSKDELPADPNDDKLVSQTAALEAIDTEVFGRMISSLQASGHLKPTDLVMIIGDGGGPNQSRDKNIVPKKQAKKTVNAGGLLVPAVAFGGPVTDQNSECDALISMTDIFATIAELAGVDLGQIPGPLRDTQSLVPLFSDSTLDHRDELYAERFTVNHENTGHPSAYDGSFSDEGFGSGETLTLDVFANNGPLLDGDTVTIQVSNAKPNKLVRFYTGYTNAGDQGTAFKDIIISVSPWEDLNKDYKADANGNLTITDFVLPSVPAGTEIFMQATVRWSKNDWEASRVVGNKGNSEDNFKRVENADYSYIFRPLRTDLAKPIEAFYAKTDRYEWTNLIENGEGGLSQEEQDNLNALRDLMELRWPGMR